MNQQTNAIRVLMVDNYDSFTFNLVHYLQQLDVAVIVKRNDQLTLAQIEQLEISHIVISPGPCDPDKAGLCLDIVKHFRTHLPILGVCLGHQVIGQAFGAKVIKADQVVHGKTSPIQHRQKGIFSGMPSPFCATRYHSLVLQRASLPSELEVTAWTEDGNQQFEHIMGIKHKTLPIEGIQFHPESVLSEFGMQMLKQFVLGKH